MIWIIARREVVTRGRSKGFRIVTGVLFLGVVVLALFQSLLFGDDDAREVTVGVTGDAQAFAGPLATGRDGMLVTVESITEEPAEALDRGAVDVVFDGHALFWESAPDAPLDRYLRDTIQQQIVADRLADAGIGPGQRSTIFADVSIEEVRLDGGDEDLGVRLVVAGASGLAIFMLLQVWGSFLMMGVVEEKSSRVVEVLLAHVRPATLLTGKILGLGALALAQMLIVVLGLALGLLLVDDITVPAGVWATVPLTLATFLLGFGFYAAAFAAVGSMISRQEDATAAQMPVMLPLLAGYFVAAGSLGAPDNAAVTIGSYLPFTSPVLLPFRNAAVSVPAWQVGVSLGILAVSIVAMLEVAGRVYRYSLLRTGGRVTWREAWRNRGRTDA